MNSNPSALLYRPFWIGTWGAIVLASLGGWLASPVLWLETGLFLGIQALVTALALWALPRYPEHASAAQMVIGLVLVVLFLVYTTPTWQKLELEGIIFGVLAAPFALGIAAAWGWHGMVVNLGAMLVFALLPSSRSEASYVGLLIFLLHSFVGWALQYFFQGFETRHRELERSVSTDVLTQIGNRYALLEDFVKFQKLAQKQGLPLLLTSWDVDGLKRINDRKGHQAGDQYILEFVKALQQAVREGDGLYRTGGDEFVALHLGLASGGRLYERVRANFPSVSGGWSRATNVSLDHALTEADVQMYAEKRAHKAIITSIIGESQTR